MKKPAMMNMIPTKVTPFDVKVRGLRLPASAGKTKLRACCFRGGTDATHCTSRNDPGAAGAGRARAGAGLADAADDHGGAVRGWRPCRRARPHRRAAPH